MRLDKAIYLRGLAQSRSRATLLINENSVSVNGKIASKPAFEVCDDDIITVIDSIGYVGRGGIKLQHAIEKFNINVCGLNAIDIGASTGGFTQCLLNHGAESVTAVDVGEGQMHESLRQDKRVVLLENTNARYLQPSMIGGKKDIAVMDVSFISQTEIYPAMFDCLKENGVAVTLLKPQFEAGSKYLNKKGVIKDKKVYLKVFEKIQNALIQLGCGVADAAVSPIAGGDGNIEFLLYIKRKPAYFDFNSVYEKSLKGELD